MAPTDKPVVLTSNGSDDSTERYYSEMESARNVSMDAYFGARPQLLKTHAEQALYRAGFERAFQHLWNKAHGSETPEQLPESLSDPAIVMERVRALHRQTDAALWLLRYLNRLGGLGQDKHRLIDAVLEGRAKVLGDTLHIEQPSEKAGEHRHGAAQDFVEYDPEGGVRIDMARYLRSPAGQAQLQELDGQNANSCVCGEPNSPGTHRTDGPCLAPMEDPR